MSEEPFSVVPRALRAAARARHAAHLKDKNGLPRWDTRTLSLREPRFQAMLRARPPGGARLDQGAFDRATADRTGESSRGLPRPLLWSLALARIHAAEQYSSSEGMGADRDPAGADPLAHIELEEAYHTRAVQEILGCLGLSFEPPAPDLTTRALVRSMSVLPRAPAEIAIFCAELAGTVVFELLLELAPSLFDGPQLGHIERLLADLIADEREHVEHARTALSAWQMGLVRTAYPLVIRLLPRELPELSMLVGGEALRDALRRGTGRCAVTAPPAP